MFHVVLTQREKVVTLDVKNNSYIEIFGIKISKELLIYGSIGLSVVILLGIFFKPNEICNINNPKNRVFKTYYG